MNDDFIKIDIKDLIKWDEPNGEGCIVSHKIIKEGWKVGYMTRYNPIEDIPDSGWAFFKGDEDSDYINNPNNTSIISINTICNYDSDIIKYLHSPIGSSYIRIDSHNFEIDDGKKNLHTEKQNLLR